MCRHGCGHSEWLEGMIIRSFCSDSLIADSIHWQQYERVRLPFVNEFRTSNTNARRDDMTIIDRLYEFQGDGDSIAVKMAVRIPALPPSITFLKDSTSTTASSSSPLPALISSSSTICLLLLPCTTPRNRKPHSSSIFEFPDDDGDTQLKTTPYHEKSSFLSDSVLDLWEPSVTVLLKILARQHSHSENTRCNATKDNGVSSNRVNEYDVFNGTVVSLDPLAFVRRVLRHNIMQPENFVIAAVLIERIRERNRITITRQNIESLFVFACVAAAKCNDDILADNHAYSQCLRVPLPIFNALELRFLHLVEFELFVSPSEYYSHECYFLPAFIINVTYFISQ